MAKYDVLIVGTGHAGAQTAIALRQYGFKGSVAMVSEDCAFPYERPPLSKDYLAGEKPFERLLIRPQTFWAERDVSVLLKRRVQRVNPDPHYVDLAGGAGLAYGMLVWAAGGAARRLTCQGADLSGVHAIRNRADVDRIRTSLPATRRVLIVGGGYVGLEAAAVLTALGKAVTVVEAQDRVLARVAGPLLSAFYEAEHRAHGVTMIKNSAVVALEGRAGQVESALLSDGTRLDTDLVIVGVGISPEVAPLIEAGARGGNGVDVDSLCRTSLPDIYAIGDCAARANAFAGGVRMRVESVPNANEQATTVARHLTGLTPTPAAPPWFWSNQYDLRLQTIGLSIGHDEAIMRGNLATRSFSVIYRREGRVIALDCVNAAKDFVQGRALVAGGSTLRPADLGDPCQPLKAMA